LSGVSMGNEAVKEAWGDGFENCQVINFILDKKVYTAIEDPSDGYRSHMRELKITKNKVDNKFPPQSVLGIMRGKTYGNENEVVDFYDLTTAKLVLSVGTESTDDYYPHFVAEFTPKNMAINADKTETPKI